MRLVTECPSCHTTFKVVRDQLRISEGWVRCGQCAEVFDTAPSLREIDEAVTAPPAVPSTLAFAPAPSVAANSAPSQLSTPVRPEVPAPLAQATLAPVPMHPVLDFPPPPVVPPAKPAPAFEDDAPAEPDLDLDFLTLHPPALDPVQHPLDPFEQEVDQLVSSLAPEPPPDVPFDAPLEPALHAEPAAAPTNLGDYYRTNHAPAVQHGESTPQQAPSFSFAAKTGARSRWQSPLVRASLSLSALALLVGLVLQVVLHERDYLAVAQPRFKPAMQRLCELLSCRIKPWQHIDKIVVESSSFTKLKPDTYRLGFVLLNQDEVELARPAIELTLTDGQNVALVRKIVLPEQLSPRYDSFAAGSEWSGSYVVMLQPGYPSLSRSVTGYQLEPFYP